MQDVIIRPEVEAFITASQTLLLPSQRPPDLTPQECELIAQHIMALSAVRTPWSGYLLSRYA